MADRPATDQRKSHACLLAAAVFAAAALAPVAASGPLRTAYAHTLRRAVAPVLPVRLAVIGDSLAAQAGLGRMRPLAAVNLAEGGMGIAQILPQAAEAGAYRPDYLLVWAGMNDVVLQGRTPEQIAADFDLLLGHAGNGPQVVVTLIPYTAFASQADRITTANVAITEAARRRGAVVVDINPLISQGGVRRARYTTDGVHLTPAAYALWRQALGRELFRSGAASGSQWPPKPA